jgi:hypothetical protein
LSGDLQRLRATVVSMRRAIAERIAHDRGRFILAGTIHDTIVSGRSEQVDPDLNRHFGHVVDAHDDAIRALRAANGQFGRAIQSHDEAIETAIAANRAAIDLLHRIANDDDQKK